MSTNADTETNDGTSYIISDIISDISDEDNSEDISDISSDDDSDPSSDITSDSMDPKHTASTSQAFQALPAELLGMIAAMLDNKDLLAMRTTCRELRDGSAFEFCQRFLDFVEISGTRGSVRQLVAILASPNLPHAQHSVKKLVVSADLLRSSKEHRNPTDLVAIMCSPTPPWEQNIIKQKQYEEPDATEVARMLRAMPKLTTFKLVGDMNVLEPLREAESAPVFLTCLAQLPRQLRCLDLFAVKLEGGLLRNVLKAHRSALRIVYFNEITLDSVPEWRRVLEILKLGRIRRFELAWLRYSVRIESYLDSHPQIRSNPFHSVPTTDVQTTPTDPPHHPPPNPPPRHHHPPPQTHSPPPQTH